MISSIIYKLTAVFVMAATVYASSETSMEQPTKLLGGNIYKNKKTKKSLNFFLFDKVS